MYQSIAKGWKFGSDLHNYLTQIRKQKMNWGDLPEKSGELERQLDELDGFGIAMAHIALIVKNPVRDFANMTYVLGHSD